MKEQLYGTVEGITYFNEENGYGVVKIKLDYRDHTIAKHKSKLFSNELIVTGYFSARPSLREEYDFTGEFTQTKFGLQFKADTYQKRDPKSEAGVVSYLSSDFFQGVGKKSAQKVYETLGEDCIQKIYEDPSVLDAVKLTDKQKHSIASTIQEQRKDSDDLMFLLGLGISMHFGLKIQKTLGKKAGEIIRNNPYRLIDLVDGINFIRADKIALNLGIDPLGVIRIKAIILFFLKDKITQSGDCYVELYELKSFIYEHLARSNLELEDRVFQEALDSLLDQKRITIENKIYVYDAYLYKAEVQTAKYLYDFVHSANESKYEKEKVLEIISNIANNENISYAPKQEEAIVKAIMEPVVIITGGPGTGKSTIIKAIIESLTRLETEEYRKGIALLAPTGRAAKRLKEITGHSAQTIHKFLGFEGHGIYKYGPEEQVFANVVIVDEVSMVDILLITRLFGATPKGTKIILVGDQDQLPSVGPGQVLNDLIRSKELISVALDQIHRQAENSTIIELAHSVNQGFLPETILEKTNDRSFLVRHDSYIASEITRIVKQGIDTGMDLIKDIQVLLPLYKGDVGINYINYQLQEKFNPNVFDRQITHLGRNFRTNDKVIQLVNRSDKQVMNGDIGFVKDLDEQNGKFVGLYVEFDMGEVYYTINELEDLSHAYAISIHKAQGSEFDLVILPFSYKHYIMLKRKLIYTAITRAKKYLIMLGNIDAMKKGISEIELDRKSMLKERIQEVFTSGTIQDVALKNDEINNEEVSPYDFL